MFNKRLILKEIKKCGLTKEIKPDELMKKHTSWRIGGIADFFCIPPDVISLKKVLLFAENHEIPIYVIGNGTNLWVPDEGIRGLVVKVSGAIDKIEYSGKMIKAGSGILLPDLVKKMTDKELSGMEFAAHIPGTLGGAIINNAGFNNKSMADIVKQITVLDYKGNLIDLGRTKLNFSYRGIDIGIEKFVITGAVLEMIEDEKVLINERIKKYYKKRKSSQPLEYLSAGCVFKNTEKESAGYLIEKAGAKGLTIGDAQVSEKHANFIINRGNATARDILLLIEEVSDRVEKSFGIALEIEIDIIGLNYN
ncbi:MAG: UDP-N-acetylmuramate dehydrogenase [Candidatus Caldatribacteriota bacterium]